MSGVIPGISVPADHIRPCLAAPVTRRCGRVFGANRHS
jgi:hypothetical protein